MWLVNVVIIITFLFFVLNIITRAIKQKEIYLYIILSLANIFEAIFIAFLFTGKELCNILQVLILVFSYILPIVVVILNSADVTIRLKILYAVSCLSYSLKKYEFASGLLAGAIKNDKKNVKFYYLRGKALEKLGDLAGARDMLFKVIEFERENKQVYLELAQILDRENKKDTALVMLSQVLKIDEDYVEAKEMMGIIYSEIGRYKEALSIYEELAASDKGTYNTYYNLAIIYWQNNELDKAIKAYNVAVGMYPKLYKAYYALGKLYYIEENYEQSIYNLNKALKDNELKGAVEYILSQIYIKQDELDKAAQHLEYSIKEDKTYLEKAKKNEIFDVISLELSRFDDETKELETITYDLQENLE